LLIMIFLLSFTANKACDAVLPGDDQEMCSMWVVLN